MALLSSAESVRAHSAEASSPNSCAASVYSRLSSS